MLYTDPLSKVAVWLRVQLFWYSVLALFLSLFCDFFFFSVGFICDYSVNYYQAATEYPQNETAKKTK